MPSQILVLNKSWIVTGLGDPEGREAGPVGSLYLREDGQAGTSLYVKEGGAGTTGWRAFPTPPVPYVDLTEAVPGPPPPDVARLYGLDANGYTVFEVVDSEGRVLRPVRDNILIAKVTAPAGVARGDLLYIAGASGANVLVGLAKADSMTTMPAVGLAMDSVPTNGFVRVMLLGRLTSLNTSARVEGDQLFVSAQTAGAWTAVPPSAPAYLQRVGIVVRQHAMAGEVLVLVSAALSPGVPVHHATHEPGGTDTLQASAAIRLFGRGTGTAGPMQELTIGGGLTMTGTQLQAPRSSTLVNYTYNSTTTEPPIAGQVRMNALHPFTAATKLWMRFVSADGQDVYWGVMIIEAGMTLLFQDKDDHTLYARFTVTGPPVDKGLYAEIPVTWASNGGAIVTAQQILMQRSGGATPTALMAQVERLEARLLKLENVP